MVRSLVLYPLTMVENVVLRCSRLYDDVVNIGRKAERRMIKII